MARKEWFVGCSVPSARTVALAIAALSCAFGGCVSSAPPAAEAPAAPPYHPNFKYAVADSGEKIDVTVGIVAPQFSGDGVEWWKRMKGDETTHAMTRSLKTSFTELLVAKGFNAAGPFDGIDEMTYPEKQGCDFVLYPDFEVDISMETVGGTMPKAAQTQENKPMQLFSLGGNDPAPVVSSCSAKLVASGSIALTVNEPMTKEKMKYWKVDISQPTQSLEFKGADCEVENGVTRGAANAWAKLNEDVYQNVMKSLDRYVNAQEFQDLKKQSVDLRAKKVF